MPRCFAGRAGSISLHAHQTVPGHVVRECPEQLCATRSANHEAVECEAGVEYNDLVTEWRRMQACHLSLR
jgi:hypothetical protein